MAPASDHLQVITKLLDEYEAAALSLRKETVPERIELIKGRLRDIGRRLETSANNFGVAEDNEIARAVEFVVSVSVVSGIIAIFVVVVAGGQLASSVANALKKIVRCAEGMARGGPGPGGSIHEVEEVNRVRHAVSGMAERLEKMEKGAEYTRKMAAIGTQIARVAHELNNPISNIGLSAGLLVEALRSEHDQGRDEKEREFREEMLVQILDQVDRARRTVRSLLRFSRDKELKLAPLSLSGFLSGTRKLFPVAVASGMLTTEVLEDGSFYGDSQELQQAVANLVENAIQAVREKGGAGGRVVLRGLVDRDAALVVIEVADNGPGIPPEIMDNIFDPFFTTKDAGQGSGLGLAIAQEIVALHKGTILVESEAGKGTVFTIKLPLWGQGQPG